MAKVGDFVDPSTFSISSPLTFLPNNGEVIDPYGDMRIEVARGNVEGISSGFFSGINRAVPSTYATLSPQGGLYPFPTVAAQLSLTSTDANDTAAGTGARSVHIIGLDANYDLLSEIITLNGLTTVTTISNFLRVNSFVVATAGLSGANIGQIDLLNGADILGRLVAGEGLMKQMVYTVAAGHSMINTNQVFSGGKDDEIEVQEFANISGAGPFLGFGVFYIYQNVWNFEPQAFFLLPEKTDIDIRALKTAGTTGKISGFYEFFLADNSVL